MSILLTERLRLEPFAEHHLDGLHEMNRRPEVMQYITGQAESREQTAEGIARVQRCWAAWGTGWWAFVRKADGRIVGAGCVQHLRPEAAMPADLDSLRNNPLEIGWRLHPEFWHQGLASEAAERMAAFAFTNLDAKELLAVRHPANADSARVMDRLGMRFRATEFWCGTNVATHAISRESWLEAHSGRNES
ncbi:MAG: GNAT family N-acetyltransferase [Rhodocyclaceae bacterium]|nr:GNAT family N-acetyltransferase [Pseudomonadota bacterium]MDQ7971952.1 GNAT family N-acetyltransferase [Rhodocyclaceae bacterium]MDQ7999496.1 GNAT family N-acetyltransferase [Pseudomonadota bacterium]